MTKTQVFNYVYGLFSEDIDENVVESHISKLRKRLRLPGYDPMVTALLGYRLSTADAGCCLPPPPKAHRPSQLRTSWLALCAS